MSLLTLNDAKSRIAAGECARRLLGETRLTPSARDYLREVAGESVTAVRSPGPVAAQSSGKVTRPAEPILPDYEFRWKAGADPSSSEAIESFFNSPEIEILKRRIVDMGRRMWQKGYTDGNGGNLTIRVGDNLVLCTPTLMSKGFMQPEDMCLVDFDGKQLAGRMKRTSEVMTHLGIMRRQPEAKACCHAHPPHATAFAVAKVSPPTCLIPEAEVFLGVIGSSKYCTPGSPENADTVGEAAIEHQAVLMENHGVITWGKDIEDAYWKMENTDAYCQTVLLASMLGKPLTPISGEQAKDLIKIRKQLGMADYRESWKECELCDNTEFAPGFASQPSPCALPATDRSKANKTRLPDAGAERVIREVTRQLLERMKNGG